MSVRMSVHMSVLVSVCLSLYLLCSPVSISLCVCVRAVSVHPSVCAPVSLYVCLSPFVDACPVLSVPVADGLPACLSSHSSLSVSVCVSVSVSCLYLLLLPCDHLAALHNNSGLKPTSYMQCPFQIRRPSSFLSFKTRHTQEHGSTP